MDTIVLKTYERCITLQKEKNYFFVCYIRAMNEANIVGKNSYNPLSSYPLETTNESSYSLKYSH